MALFLNERSAKYSFFDVISDQHFIKRDISNRHFDLRHFKFRDEKPSETNAKTMIKINDFDGKNRNGTIQTYNMIYTSNLLAAKNENPKLCRMIYKSPIINFTSC